MSSNGSCSECGKPIPAESPGRFCACCLLGLGLEKTEELPDEAIVASRKNPTGLPSTEKPGDRIRGFHLLQEIGRGGCGVVYMAEQEKPVRRKVALKVIKLGMDTHEVVTRFEAERQALAMMDHPNIAKVLEAGATDTGRPFFVMELVGGIKITDYCDQNNLTARERLDLFIPVCRAVQHAHQKGIIHRDIKPSNVLVALQDGVPVPKVIDFGIAKATQGRLTDHTLFTAFEQFIGTPAYMSPEQAQFGGLDVDTRSDIYSLGVLLYELLTGRTPFDEKELMGAGVEAMRRTICEKEPPKPSTRLSRDLDAADAKRRRESEAIPPAPSIRPLPTRELIHLLRGDLDWIVMKCLEKNRARRYETANGLAVDIQRHLDQEPVLARPPSRAYQFQKFILRHKLAVTSGTAIAVVLVAGATVSTWQAIRATRAEREQSHLRTEAQLARQDATGKLWLSYLAEARARRISGQSGQRFKSLEAISKAAAILPSLELRNEAIASMVMADIQSLGGKDFSKDRLQVSMGGDLEHYAVIDTSGNVKIRRVSDDTDVATLPVTGKATAIGSWSPDGKFLAVFSDQHWHIWDWAKSAMMFEGAVIPSGTAFNPDSLMVLDGTNIVIRDLVSGAKIAAVPLGDLAVPSETGWCCVNHSGKRIALYCGLPGTNIFILDTQSGRTLQTLSHGDYLFEVAWHPDGRHLAAACADNSIYVWDTVTGERVKTISGDSAVSVDFNRDGNLMVVSGWDGKTRLFDFPAGRQLASIYTTGRILGFSLDGRKLATRGWDGNSIQFFEVVSSAGLQTIHEQINRTEKSCGPAFFSSSGRLLAYAVPEGVKLWDVLAGREVAMIHGEDLSPSGFCSQDRNLLLQSAHGILRCAIGQSSPDGQLHLETPVLVCERLTSANVSADGTVCVGESDGHWEVVRTDSFTELARTEVQRVSDGITISPDGTLLASGAWHHSGINVWDAKTCTLIRQLPADDGHIDTAASAVFSPDSRYLVISTSKDYCLWKTDSWTLARRIPQQSGNDFRAAMSFSQDGKLFAGTHSRNVVRLYDAASGQILADLEAAGARQITSLSFSPDGTRLAAGELRQALRVWDLRMIREKLAGMKLDWDMPPYPPKP